MSWPVFIASRGRADISGTARLLETKGKRDFRIVVEQDDFDDYARRWGEDRLLVLPQRYIDEYDPLDGIEGFPKGPGPARNFIWDTAAEEGRPRARPPARS